MSDPIRFTAQVAKVQSLADGGLRVTLDLGEDAIMQAAQLMECKRWGAVVEVTAIPSSDLINRKESDGKVSEGPKRKSEWTPAKG